MLLSLKVMVMKRDMMQSIRAHEIYYIQGFHCVTKLIIIFEKCCNVIFGNIIFIYMIDVKRLRLQFEIRITIEKKVHQTKHVLKSVMIRNMSKSQSIRLT